MGICWHIFLVECLYNNGHTSISYMGPIIELISWANSE